RHPVALAPTQVCSGRPERCSGATRRAAREALDLFGLATETPATPGWECPNYSTGEPAEIVAGCYELLLLLADAMAQPQSDEDPRRSRESQCRPLSSTTYSARAETFPAAVRLARVTGERLGVAG